jgi:hypothetical protein
MRDGCVLVFITGSVALKIGIEPFHAFRPFTHSLTSTEGTPSGIRDPLG